MGVTLFELLSGGTDLVFTVQGLCKARLGVCHNVSGVTPFIYEALHNLSEVTHDPKRWETLKKQVMNEDVVVISFAHSAQYVFVEFLKTWIATDSSELAFKQIFHRNHGTRVCNYKQGFNS